MSATRTHAFICSKPFQFINLLNLPYDYHVSSTTRLLIVLDHFPDARVFADQISQVFPYWQKIVVIRQREEVAAILRRHKVSVLYSELDTGKVAYLWSLIVKELFVYEEGTQTYRNIRTQFSKTRFFGALKERLTGLLGWGAYLGTNRKTKHLFVYNPAYFNNHLTFLQPKVKPFKKDLYQFLGERLFELERLLPVSAEIKAIYSEHLAIYVTSHQLNESAMSDLKRDQHLYDRIWIKVHPHLYYEQPAVIDALPDPPFTIVKGNTLAEMMFITLLKNRNKLTILHESSTACLYLKESENIKIVDYRQGEYREFYKGLRHSFVASDVAAGQVR